MKHRVHTLSMQVTYQCNIACRHCGPYCGPEEKDWMSVEEIKDLISQAGSMGVRTVVFTGGEPTLLKAKLCDVLRHAHGEAGMINSRIVTNARFAITYERATELLKQWQDAGLQEINISCGEYHQEFVSVDYVANAYRAARDLGFKTVLMVGEFLANGLGKLTPDIFEKAVGERLLSRDTMSPFSEYKHGFDRSEVMAYGRGKHEVPCGGINYRETGSIKSVCDDVNSVLTVHPNGNVTACCGIMVREDSLLTVGNWRQQKLAEIAEGAEQDIIMNWIRTLGLRDMKDWLQSKRDDLGLRERHQNICDLCADIMYNPKCQTVLIEQGAEREQAVLLAKVAADAAESGNFFYGA
jgi:MoaA/NifB/PqqE/SkfB family radical SAM enzyme